MPPSAKKNTSRAAAPRAAKKQRKSASSDASTTRPSAAQKVKGWEFAPFTKKAVAFNGAARRLADRVHAIYGEGVSIAQFEKLCLAYDGLTPEEQDIIDLDGEAIQLLITYQKARDARDAERASFRGDIKVQDVEGKMAALLSAWGGTPHVGASPGAGGGDATSVAMDA